MDKVIFPCKINGKINAISSKSYAHRIMLCAFLSNQKIKIKGVTFSQDVLATLSVLKGLGAKVKTIKNSIIFEGRDVVEQAVLDCFESGSTLRFSLPLVCALGIKAKFLGSERLLSRPNDALINCLKNAGIEFNNYNVSGSLKGGKFIIDASISSQYISGLLMALPLLKEDSELVLEGEIVSSNYIDITLEILNLSGIKIEKTSSKTFFIKGGQMYKLPKNITINGDWSSASFMLVAGAIKGNCVRVKGLKNDSQGDKIILDVIKQYGAEVSIKNDQIIVRGKSANGINVDLTNSPDLAPIVSVLGATSRSNTTIKGVDRLKIKESDRLNAIIKMLKQVGVETEYHRDTLTIKGVGIENLTKGEFDGENDHRMVMSQAILSTINGGKILGAEAINKSYPNFFLHLEKIGGKLV